MVNNFYFAANQDLMANLSCDPLSQNRIICSGTVFFSFNLYPHHIAPILPDTASGRREAEDSSRAEAAATEPR